MSTNRLCPAWTVGVFTATAVFAFGHVGRADVISAPPVVATAFQHTYSVGGKTTVTTHIEDFVQSSTDPAWTPTWHDPPTWVSTLTAPNGYRFVVTPAPGFGHPTTMGMGMTWSVSTAVTDFTVFFSTTSYAFDGLIGAEPTLVNSSSIAGQALYTLGARANLAVSEPFSFTSVTFTTSPPYNLELFPAQTYTPIPGLTLSIDGNGSLPDSTLISLQPVPEPAPLFMLAVAGLMILVFRQGDLWRLKNRDRSPGK